MNIFIERELMDFEIATIRMVYNTTVEYALAPYCSLTVYFVKESIFKNVIAEIKHCTLLLQQHITIIIQNVMLNVWFSIIIIIIHLAS